MRSRNQHLLVLFSLCMVMFTFSSASLLITPILPELARSFDVSLGVVGESLSYYAFAFAIALLPCGPLADRFNKRRLMMIGLSIFAFANLGCALSATLPSLLFFRAITGVAGAMISPSLWGYAAEYFPFEQRGRAVGIIMSSFSLVPVLGVPFGALFAETIGWPAVFMLLAVSSILSVLGLSFLPDVLSKATYVKGRLRDSVLAVLRSKAALIGLGTTLFMGSAHWGLFSYLPGYLTKLYGFSTLDTGLFLSLYGVAGIAANQIGGRLGDRMGKKRLLVRAMIVYMLPLVLLPLWHPHPYVTLILLVLWNTALSIGLPPQIAIISELVPAARSTMMSMNTATFNLGITMGTALGGYVMAGFRFEGLAFLCAALAVINVLFCNRLPEDAQRSETSA